MDDAPMLRTPSGKPDATSRHVLQALAEHARMDGTSAHPSVARLQYRTGYDRRTVQRALRRLEDAKLIVRDGAVQDRTRWRLSMNAVRPPSDWEELERSEEASREAATERKRRSRARHVTHSEDVTVTHSDGVTEGDVTHSESGRHALEVRDVTHLKAGRHALSAAVTTNQPKTEPPTTGGAQVDTYSAAPRDAPNNAPIDDANFSVTDVMRRWAHTTFPALDVDHSTAQFVSHYRATGAQRKSWPDAWQKWIRDDAKRAAERRSRAPGKQPPEDASPHDEWMYNA